MSSKKSPPIRHLRRYGGCRLYDPESKVYLSASDLEHLIRQGVRISVREVETGQDVTHEVIPPSPH
ncbi:polyhydroxyalkanoate synthesis regulator DNA-binding domain-containing protein [Methylobacterium nodulans]|uniref:PHA accumulation regulator DNA-binding N-terminal domain-containing protein n=1 Tax=Methylobacterium nodulans (strain LMG 21967 / CNCM I-2342 / ORS 2060) TaxID=460265 RepID=B8IB78_METNO|nr:polyhydroxyalkanoate synthesis regulator DNA-binding domain-containing protein [Methylobacterium nodulans]ACL57293.1 conserved hypothetical protein [Methylobacterium nodulans ORS 2060]